MTTGETMTWANWALLRTNEFHINVHIFKVHIIVNVIEKRV